METLVQPHPLSHNHQTDFVASEPQPPSEKLDASSQPFALGAKPHLLYKCLLNQHAQKLWKPAPIYQTQNEGFQHLPKFRSTVWIDGVSYTSSNTFHQRRMAEMDVSKIAYLDIIQKSKTEALHAIREDTIFCKSIMAEYAAKIYIEKPIYETIQLGTSIPVFRSSLLFNGVTYQGDVCKSKKEAEQLVARAIILKYLDSESGTDMAEIINSKFRHTFKMNKIQEMNSAHNGITFEGAQTGVDHDFALTEAKVMSGSSIMPKLSPVVTQPPIPEASIESIPPAVAFVTRPHIPEVSIQAITPVTEPPIPEVSIQTITPAVPGHVVLTQCPSAEVSDSSTFQSLEYIPLTAQTSGKKRNRKNKKNARKKMHVDAQMPIPVLPATQALPFSSQ